MENKFAAQLFTLHKELKQGIRPIFKTLKEMGWSGVQISALPEGYDPREVALALEENQLKTAGMHVSLERLKTDLKGVLTEAELYNTKDIICPYLSSEFRNEKGYKVVKETLNRIASEAPYYRISYHNHSFEFETEINGQDALQYILEPSQDNNILAELDVYWLKKGEKRLLDYINLYKDRMPIIHLKDMTNDEQQTFAEIGTGIIDFVPIIQWGETNGIEWYVVEQDVCPRPPLDCLYTSLLNLKEIAKQIQN